MIRVVGFRVVWDGEWGSGGGGGGGVGEGGDGGGGYWQTENNLSINQSGAPLLTVLTNSIVQIISILLSIVSVSLHL